MDSQEPTIEEKLVPFVEGALAEADRREVLQALPNSPALTQEVRQLKDVILALRTQAAQGMTYRSPVEAPPEQVVDYALQSEQWSRQSSRQFQLHMLESPSLAEEIEILRELEEDLEQRVEAAKPVPEMPGALRTAILETYGRPAPEPGWKKTLAAMVAWMAGMNLKVAAAACVLVVGGLAAGRYMHDQAKSRPSGGYAAVQNEKATGAAAPVSTPAAPSPPPPAGQVALLKEQVHPEDLPRLSRLLWQKQVSHSYRDGQIYVAQADYDKAWTALQINEKIAMAQPLETKPVKDDKKTDLEGGIIGTPDGSPAAAPARPPAPAVPPRPVTPVEAKKGDYRGPVTRPTAAVAVVPVEQPAAPEASRGPADDANRDVPGEPVLPAYEPARKSEGRRYTKARERDTYEAPPLPRQDKAPTQSARYSDQLPAYSHEPPKDITPMKSKGGPGRKPGEQFAQQSAVSPPPVVVPAPAPEQAANADMDPVAPPVQPINRPADQVASKVSGNKEARQEQKRTEEEAVGPTVAQAPRPLPPSATMDNLEKKGAERGYDESVNLGKIATGQAKSENTARPATKVAAGEAGGTLSNRAIQTSASASEGQQLKRQADNENFEVSGNAPFEVAMLPVAKKLVEELVGEAKVQMERKEDGHLLVTIRPTRSLSPQEVDKLRKVVREKLELQEEDTVVIRQP